MVTIEGEQQVALVAMGDNNMEKKNDSKKTDDKDKLFCSHCRRSRHTRDTRWELHGRPKWAVKNQEQGKVQGQKKPNTIHNVATQDTQSGGVLTGTAREYFTGFDPNEDIMNSFQNHLESYGRAPDGQFSHWYPFYFICVYIRSNFWEDSW
ncbi:PREDICTED: uncharacterized protein LOC104595018 [Nelumbo nucifera]|uniref:Uncharacterized protein LOC104595017 n=1 Tax=Nelumbo nucifera TaxID=4432 RepID=A0A1U7ZKY8_NELNU|nr:PREDICTED: uncharacterized protein LOC104595017 [Nelumbo nucifera]XP_010253864.1 PREDICTED: uncharacterized protein LOC104595018 [Nelumbo nucifera]